MADFWSKVLGESTTPSALAPVPADNAAAPWWERTAVQLPQNPGQPPSPPTPEQAPQPVDASASMARTEWHKQGAGNCPSCGGTNYHSHPEAPQARPRCYDCGYPIRQSGSGATFKGQAAGPVQAARQTEAAVTNSFNPRHIFDRIG